MENKKRPVSRRKNIGTGCVSVEKRGSGTGRKTQGPVGGSGGLFSSKKTTGTQSKSASGKSKLILLLIAGVVIYFIVSKLKLPDTQTYVDTTQPQVSSANTAYDNGAYSVDRTLSEGIRPKRTEILGNASDEVTIMLYLLGTDLESRAGMATMDLQEILDADISQNINIVIETGGTATWKNNTFSNKTNQRYLITSNGMQILEKDLGRKSMVDPDTLTDFISYTENRFPADRYFLIFWDHGGGSVTGYGYDELFKGDNMTLDEIGGALKKAGCEFDLIGFDACLMATLETAHVVEPYADYLIASEEVEPGIGWYYTGWINELSKNTSIETIDLGKKLIDDYINEVKKRVPKSQATLSLVDLAELKSAISDEFISFARSTGELIESDNYKTVADSRAVTKEFAASSKINQIDLIDFLENLKTTESEAFSEALKKSVKYNRMSDNITNSNGLSIFFPFGRLNDVESMVETYEEIGLSKDYTDTVKSFANLNAGGQMASPGGSILDMLTGSGGALQGIAGSLINNFMSQGDFSSITGSQQAPQWLDTNQIQSSEQYYDQNMIDPASIVITNKNGQKVLDLSDEEWDLVKKIELSVFIDDSQGFIDLGRDNVFEYNDELDLILEYDGTWLTLNGNIVSYYLTDYDAYGDNYTFMGRIPALLNDERVDIIVSFDQDKPDGSVLGARKIYETQEAQNLAKGLIDINEGDRIDFLCDYYTYKGEFNDTYFLGNSYVFNGSWIIENLEIVDMRYLMSYKLTDIYGNSYWTPAISSK